MLVDYFSSVLTREPDGDIPVPEETSRCFNSITSYRVAFEYCTIDPSIVALRLNTYKSPWSDGLHPCVLNKLTDTISVPLSIIFKTSLTISTLLTDWKKANISAILNMGCDLAVARSPVVSKNGFGATSIFYCSCPHGDSKYLRSCNILGA